MASLAAILAIGKPVALEASADERDARVHLDDDHAPGARVHRELDVAAAGVDADLADDRDGDVAHVLVLAVGQGQRGRHGDAVAGVHAHRVDVLDGADDDDVVGLVAHDLQLVLLPAEDRLLQEHLGGRGGVEPGTGDAAQVLLRVREAGAGAAHGEGGPHDQRVTQLARGGHALVHGVADDGPGGLGVEAVLAGDLGDDLLELLAVLARLDRVEVGADQLDLVLLQHAGLVQRHGGVERRLAAQRGQQRVGPLLGDDLLDELGGDRLDVRGVGELRVRHDRGGVAVDQDHAEALGPQHAARLGAGVVELARLADHDRPRADHQDRLDVLTLWHGS
jgi:hypothetical protein